MSWSTASIYMVITKPLSLHCNGWSFPSKSCKKWALINFFVIVIYEYRTYIDLLLLYMNIARWYMHGNWEIFFFTTDVSQSKSTSSTTERKIVVNTITRVKSRTWPRVGWFYHKKPKQLNYTHFASTLWFCPRFSFDQIISLSLFR